MDEFEFAEQVLITAEQLHGLTGNREVLNRFIASKLYYGAHHLGRLLLKKRGATPETWVEDVHRRVIEELERKYVDTGILSSNSVECLKLLRTKRIKADYLLNRFFQSQKIFRLFRELLEEVRLLLLTL